MFCERIHTEDETILKIAVYNTRPRQSWVSWGQTLFISNVNNERHSFENLALPDEKWSNNSRHFMPVLIQKPKSR